MAAAAEVEQKPRTGPGAALAAILLAITTLNFVVTWTFSKSDPPEAIGGVIIGVCVFQPMLFAVWAALGTGRLVIRVPLIVPCLMLAIAAPGLRRSNFEDVQRYEFVGILVCAFGVFAATCLLLLIARRFTGWRIDRLEKQSSNGPPRFQFDTKYLLALITLYAAALGVTTGLSFGPTQQNLFFGANFVVYIMAVGSALISLLLLPIIALPLLILSDRPSRNFFLYAALFWAVVTFAAGALWIPITEASIDESWYLLLIQLGAAVTGIAAALPLRWAGFRLVSRKPLPEVEPVSEQP